METVAVQVCAFEFIHFHRTAVTLFACATHSLDFTLLVASVCCVSILYASHLFPCCV